MRFVYIGLLLLCACKSGAERVSAGEEAPAAVVQAKEVPSKSKPAKAAMGQVPVRLPGIMEPAPWLEDANRVVAYGQGDKTVIVAAGTHWLRWFSKDGKKLGEHVGVGGVQVLEASDLDGDGTIEIIVGRGRARGANDAPASLEVLRLGKKTVTETISLPETSRAQVVAAVPVPGMQGGLWVASFVSKFEVAVDRYARDRSGQWSRVESRGRHRVVGDMSVLPDGTPVIAKMYGDTSDAPGGVYALTSESTVAAIPSTRGARALLAMPGPQMSLAMADGWHKEYGKRAQGLVTVMTQDGNVWKRSGGVHVAKVYGFSRLRLGNVHSTEKLAVIASGNGNAVVMLPNRPELLYELADRVAYDAYPIDLGGDSRMEVVIAGPDPAIWSAR